MTPQESLDFLKPAFLDLFNRPKADLARFLRLAVDVFDPDPGYGPMRCKGDGMILPAGCGKLTIFRVAALDGIPYGYQCTQCGCVFPYSLTKSSSFKKAPSRITLTSDGSSTLGHCKAETESGISFTDASDLEQQTPTWDTHKQRIVIDTPSRTYLTAEAAKKEIPPVDRSARTLTDGSPVTEDHRELRPDGQQKGYVVLSAEERAKGFVRPVRETYIHVGKNPVMKGHVLIKAGEGGCGTRTTMGISIAETYARDPKFYGGTFCCSCRTHFPLDQFVWEGTNEQVGS